MVSLVVSAGLTAFGNYLNSILPFGKLILTVLNIVVSIGLISVLFAAIYKILPDRHLEWRDVVIGAVVTVISLGAPRWRCPEERRCRQPSPAKIIWSP
jgi:membrane protein